MAIQKETLTKVGVASVAVAVPSAAAFFDPFGFDLAALEVQDEDYVEIDEPTDIDTDGNTSSPSQQITENAEETAKQEVKKAQRKRRAAEVTAQRNKKLATPLLTANTVIYSALNNPGHCVTDLFKGIKQSNAGFFDTSSVTDKITNIKEEKVFEGTSKPTFACYTYKEQLPGTTDRKAYVELAVKNDKEGWVWSAWLTNGGSFQKLWYREYVLTNKDNKWTVKVGHEGEIDPKINIDKDGNVKPSYKGEFVNNWKHNFKWIKFSGNDDLPLRGQDAYWTAKDKGPHKLVDLSVNAGSQITRWSSAVNKQRLYERNNRKRVYQENKWYTYNPPVTGNKKLIRVSDPKVALRKGVWKPIKDLCGKEDNNSPEFNTLCLNN